jgi:hypothetical protein
VRFSVLLPAELAHAVDEEAARMTATDEHGRVASRTDAFRSLLLEGLRRRGARKDG